MIQTTVKHKPQCIYPIQCRIKHVTSQLAGQRTITEPTGYPLAPDSYVVVQNETSKTSQSLIFHLWMHAYPAKYL